MINRTKQGDIFSIYDPLFGGGKESSNHPREARGKLSALMYPYVAEGGEVALTRANRREMFYYSTPSCGGGKSKLAARSTEKTYYLASLCGGGKDNNN